jgi:hypothetical protein
MDSRERAVQARRRAQFLEGSIRFLLDQGPELLLLPGDRAGRATGPMVLGAQVPKASALLQELLDHAQRNPKPMSDRLPGALPGVVGGHNPFT